MKHYFKENVNIIGKYRTNKLSMFSPMEHRTSWNQKANFIQIIQFPACHN